MLWCITGAGHLIRETCELIDERFVVCVSRAGEEVLRAYGIKLNPKELIKESEQSPSFSFAGRVFAREFSKVIIAPCTSNTLAKIAHGIADSLVANIAAQALKVGVELVVLPSDVASTTTSIPIYVERKLCECETCDALLACPRGAFYDKGKLKLSACDACKLCVSACKRGAVSFGKKISLSPRRVDLENIQTLRSEGVKIVESLEELKKEIE